MGTPPSPPPRLTRREFARALRLGLGRARIDVRRHGLAGREDLFVASCLRDRPVLYEVETSRAPWLAAIARDAGVVPWLRDHLIAASARVIPHRHDREQVARLLCIFGEDGDRQAASAALALLGTQPWPDTRVAEAVTYRLGLRGWTAVVRSFARRWQPEDPPDLGWLPYLVRKTLGTRRALAALPRGGSRGSRAFAVAMSDAIREEGRRPRTPAAPEPRFDASLDALESIVRTDGPTGPSGFHLRKWGREAAPADVEEAWRRTLRETDVWRIRRRLFALELDPQRRPRPVLFDLAGHADPLVREAAHGCLENVQSPLVRDLALRRVRESPERAIRDDVLRLFELNATDSDADVLAGALDAVPPARRSAALLHNWVRAALDSANPLRPREPRQGVKRTGSAWEALLLRVVEVAPCRDCRESAFADLAERSAVPRSLAREALWDSQPETRAAARRVLRAANRP